MSETAETDLQVQTGWPPDALDAPKFANQSLVAPAPGGPAGPDGGVYVVLGHIAFPLINDRTKLEQYLANRGDELEVLVHGAYYLSKPRAEELWYLLGQQIGRFPPGPLPVAPASAPVQSQQ